MKTNRTADISIQEAKWQNGKNENFAKKQIENCTYIYHNRIDKNRAAEGLLLSERPKNMIGKDSTLVWKLGMALVHQLEEFALVE